VDTTIYDALKVMLEKRIGAIVIKSQQAIVGIWTERDLMRNTVTPGFDPKIAKIGDYMVTDLLSAKHTATVYQLLDTFLGRRLRHLLIEKDGAYIGILSTGDVVKAELLEKTEELKELSSMVNWQYYDNWSAPKK
jgi:signal-transduction protein with cAMP-binding, CBS, and nucleotidyltransferase domain